MMIEVFKTNICQSEDAAAVIDGLSKDLPGSRINIDLHDCDKILRIEAQALSPVDIVALVRRQGFRCEVLE